MIRTGSRSLGIYHSFFMHQFRGESHHQRGFRNSCVLKSPARERYFVKHFIDDLCRHRVPPVSNQNLGLFAIFLSYQVDCFADKSFIFKVTAKHHDFFHAVFNKLFQNIIGQTDKSITVQINSSREQGAAAGKRFRFITIVDCRRYHTANTLRQSFGKAVSQNRIYTQRQMGAMLFAGADRQNSDRSFIDFRFKFHPGHFVHSDHDSSLL